MKTIYFALLVASLFCGTSCQSTTQAIKKFTIRTTAYTHNESDHIKYGRQTAIGTILKNKVEYTSAASDWSFLPVGTVFRIEGDARKYVIDDYGSALVGTKTIDIYQPSRRDMNRWGVRFVDIKIESMGDYSKSLAVLRDRCRYPHVRQMVAGIQRKI